MNEEIAPAVGPRRYRVSFNCRIDALGTVIGLLIKEVEQPEMKQVGDNYKLTLVCFHDQLITVLGVVIDHADSLVVAPYVPEAKLAPAVYRPPQQLARVVTPLQRELPERKRHRVNSRSGKQKDTGTGKALMSAFDDNGRVKHPADFAEAMTKHGYNPSGMSSVINRIISEGDLVRVGHVAAQHALAGEPRRLIGRSPGRARRADRVRCGG